MSRSRLAAVLLTLLAATSPARAQPVAPRADTLKARAAEVYKGDPDAARKVRVEELFGLYLVDPPRRHASERVELTPGGVTLNYWQPLGESTDAMLIARAVQFFLLGRTQFGAGVRSIFDALSAVSEVTLVFHEVSRHEGGSKQQHGRRAGDETVTPYLRLRLSRSRFERLKLAAVEKCVAAADCATVFRVAFDEARFDRRGLKIR
ncbi:MAG: hypothetical protein EXR76_19620 [Myxococcales bacterium]|nr:hypothetical protein [Myxococcales bacterium]